MLIDEYDSPITENLNDMTKAKQLQTVLQKFFKCLKYEQRKIPLVYITAVTKFTKANLFSGLNNLIDLSRSEEFNEVCGFTRSEIEKNMMGLLQVSINKGKGVDHNNNNYNIIREDVDKKLDEIASFYDGYRFSPNGKPLFSPSATIIYFKTNNHQEFVERTPHVKLVYDIFHQSNPVDFPVSGNNISMAQHDITNLDELDIEHILLDTGIHTIKRYNYSDTYFLDFPNPKVRQFTFQNLIRILQKSKKIAKLQRDAQELLGRLSILNRNNAHEFF